EIPARELENNRTLFIFPFNRADFPKEKMVEEIAKALADVDPRSLIFLSSIRSIKWRSAGKGSSELRKAVLSHEVLKNNSSKGAVNDVDYYVSSISKYGKIAEQWRVFSMLAPLDSATSARVEIAFIDNPNAVVTQIGMVEPSLLHVCFPTHKKVPVGYILNAPFLTTPSRDNLDNNSYDQNEHFIKASVDLLKVALLQFKKENLIGSETLSTLAIERRQFPSGDLFKVIFDKTKQLLLDEAVLPTLSGGYSPARFLLIPSNSEIRNLFGREEISLVFKLGEGADWLAPSIADKKEFLDYLTNDLGIRRITLEDILKVIDESYLRKQSDDWMVRFYKFCSTLDAASVKKLRSLPVVRLEDNSQVVAIGPDGKLGAYFPLKGVTDLPLVKADLIKDVHAKAFLQQLGITEPDDLHDTLTTIIPQLTANSGALLDDATYESNIRTISSAFRQASHNELLLLKSKLSEISWLRGCHGELRTSVLLRPRELYYPSDRLLNYFKTAENVWFPVLLPNSQDFLPHLAAMGMRTNPAFLRAEKHALTEMELKSIEPDQRLRGTPVDFEMQGLSEFLQRLSTEELSKKINYSRILWMLLCDIANAGDPPYAEVPREFRSRFITERAKPKWVKLLQGIDWIPDRKGKLHPPANLSLSEMASEFTHVKKLATMLEMKDVLLESLARQCGISAELLDFVRLNPDRVTELMHSMGGSAANAESGNAVPQVAAPTEKSEKPTVIIQRHANTALSRACLRG
ncbi:MAG: hypothetical protein K2X81_00775, partial [Candidatus Obscuribacterales bacterium]|nr:hypothetical protein [Candidatus Obscuribacterales bacterium]